MSFVSARSQIEPFRVMQILAAAQAKPNAIAMCVGQPATGAPQAVVTHAQKCLAEHTLGYTPTLGIPELRECIAQWHRNTYGSDTQANNIVITTGSSGGFVALFLAALEAGDTIAMTRPGYPAYRNALHALGVKIMEVPCGPETRFQPTVEILDSLETIPRALIVTSPDNPTGTIIEPQELQRIAQWCEAKGCLLISDEIYHGISYGRECATARNFSDRAVVVGSLSKYFSMTGWRLGWLIVPEYLIEPLENLEANLALCPPAISQYAALASFSEEALAEVRGHVERYAASRSLLLKRLPQLGLGKFAPPDGGFYLYVDVSHLTDNSEIWCRELLDATGVAFAPGIDFDPVNGHQYVRISFCVAPELIEEACTRLAEVL
ncbi:pyridoxal phosphate-dependent aminotransferase [Corynebacterium freiburgense]|uniref:pyridoxal phosphate-dependent aminotransferase n=1 Tax=Corynebacterium freiburgense TaxID=556548 RepID=UPI00047D0CCE|nr:aminotransferase class I/II-fold pyridoxal phosphate-dependent enzyme [Corynebacterium freiburgense]WJZ03630.1 Aspartate aminotransferase [Corynebacterium freiburgense]